MSRPPRGKTTNQEAAYYTLRGQIQMLSQKEELMAFAFEDRKKEREYGTYIIPGLKAHEPFLPVRVICRPCVPL